MKKKNILVVVALVVIVTISIFSFGLSRPQKGQFNAGKLTTAINSYCQDAKTRNSILPASISLQELIGKGYLKHEDVSAFDGMQATVNLNVAETDPQAILIRAQMSDGSQIVALADGSVQSISKK